MAYQNVGTPRFYIDLYEYMNSIGNIHSIYAGNDTVEFDGNPFGLHPEVPCTVTHTSLQADGGVEAANITCRFKEGLLPKVTDKINYVSVIGHNLSSCNKENYDNITGGDGADIDNIHVRHYMSAVVGGGTYLGLHSGSQVELVNCEVSPTLYAEGDPFHEAEWIIPEGGTEEEGEWSDGWNWTEGGYFHALHDGFSIRQITPSNSDYFKRDKLSFVVGMDGGTDWLNTQFTCNMNSVSVGTFYDMPVSPDLDLSMTVEFDGYDTTTTLGGSTLTNVRYAGAPWWVVGGKNREPWSVGNDTGISKRNGRRVWSMKFSYISDKDLFASNYMNTLYGIEGYEEQLSYTETSENYDSEDIETDPNGNDYLYYPLDGDDSFIAQVLNKVGNGQRFIFQPDNTNNNPDQFAICQLDQDSLEIKQVAFKTYSISLKIREVW